MLKPKLEYAVTMWSHHKNIHTSKLEGIQKSATKMVSSSEDLTHQERLKYIILAAGDTDI